MANQTWDAVDALFEKQLVKEDDALRAAVTSSLAAGLPAIAVSPSQGKLLGMVARMVGAKHVLEVGTLGGYSAIWLARALPDGGKVTSLEINEKHAEVARQNLARAGVEGRVEVRVGNALETLPALAREKLPPFDLAFIDADKAGNAVYFDWAVKMARSGSVIVVDNVVRDGRILDPKNDDPNVTGVLKLFSAIHGDSRVSATAIQTVGSKGYDGFLVATVL